MPPSPAPAHARTFSQVLEDLGEGEDEKLRLQEIIDNFGERGFGALILILSLLALIPWPPGGKALFSLPIALMAIELAALQHEVWAPRWARRAGLPRSIFRAGSRRVLKYVAWFERLSRPRLLFMTGPVADVLVGLTCVVLAVILALPIPFFDAVPALTLAIFGLGLMSRDGLLLLAGFAGAAGSIGYVILIWSTVVAVFHHASAWVTSLF